MKQKTQKQIKKNTKKKTGKKPQKPLYEPFANWENADEYPDPQQAKRKTYDWWSWQFLRRNPEYQKAFQKIENLPPPLIQFDFNDLPQPNPEESKRDFLKRIDLGNPDINGEQMFNLDSLYKWGILCVRFGISRPVNPKVNNPFARRDKKVNDPTASSPPLIFCSSSYSRNPMDYPRGTEGLIRLDLTESIKRNLEAVEILLKEGGRRFHVEKELKKLCRKEWKEAKKQNRNLQEPPSRIPRANFPEYLRLLDAEADGARPKEMACIFCYLGAPHQAVNHGLKEAHKWRDKYYNLFLKKIVLTFSLDDEVPQAHHSLWTSYRSP